MLYNGDMDDLPTHLRSAIAASGREIKDIAAALDVTESAVSQWQNGRSTPSLKRLFDLSEYLNVSLDTLVKGDDQASAMINFDPINHAPVLDKVQAGMWGNVVTPFSIPQNVPYVELYRRPSGVAIALEVDGYSMYPDFNPQDIIVIDTGREPLPGDLVVAIVLEENEATFKRFRPRGIGDDGKPVIELAPINQDYPTLTISGSKPGRIIGTMMQHIKFPRR